MKNFSFIESAEVGGETEEWFASDTLLDFYKFIRFLA